MARMEEEPLPRWVMFGGIDGDKRYYGGREWDWMKDIVEDLKAFGIKLER